MKELYLNSRAELFNDGWSFTEPNGTEAKTVTLPHSWNSTGWTYEKNEDNAPKGTGMYEKHIPREVLDGHSIKFDGISAYCEVFVNGEKVCENIGAYKPFIAELSNLRDGDNTITVRVTDKSTLTPLDEGCDEVFVQSPRYTRWPVGLGSSLDAGGIWRNVYLLKNLDTYMNPFLIVPEDGEFEITADFSGDTNGYSVRYTLSDGESTAEITLSADCREFSIKPEKPIFSWPLKPHLYEFKAELTDRCGNVVQTICQPASLMSFAIRNSEFKINNKPYFLRGQNGFPHCNIAHDTEYMEKYISAIKAQGVEISRFHTEPPSHEWLDECDRQGIMVIFEMPLHGSFGCYSFCSKEFEKNALSETLALVREYRRHPSIVMWSMGNELIVACERDLGLGKPLFDVLERWIAEVHKLDHRPVISNSNGDAANLITKTVGDVDDVHQYGGWYVENLYDLRHFGEYTNKNDMLFQPCISTESIAGYTDENEEFFLKHNDVRQRKVVAMRLGEITDLKRQSRDYQSFMLKEYAEAMWRLRREDSSFAGYIPFGQYTWFFKPFQKDGIIPKTIWSTYRKVMSPVHIQLECFSRHTVKGGYISGKLGVWNENVHLSNPAEFVITAKVGEREYLRETIVVPYHKSVFLDARIGPLENSDEIVLEVFCGGERVSMNTLSYRVYNDVTVRTNSDTAIYDPENMLCIDGTRRIS